MADTGHAASTGPNAAHRRVVVTGMGVVSCLGHDIDTFYDNLLEVKLDTRHDLGSVELINCFTALALWSSGTYKCRVRQR